MATPNWFEVNGIDSGTTTDATPRNMGQVSFLGDAVLLVKGRIVAMRESDLATKAWTFESLVRRQAGDVTVLKTIPAPPNVFANAADTTALSAVSIAVFSDANSVGATCTGLAATTIHWAVNIEGRGINLT